MSSSFDSGGTTLKRRVISLLIIGMIVVGAWYGIAAISNLIFQGSKYTKSQQLSNTEPVKVNLDPISLSNFTLPDNISSLFNGTIPDWLQNLLTNNPSLAGNLGNFTNPDQLNQVVFRVYPEGSTTLSSSDLWRYTAYDVYNGTGWARSDPSNYPLSETPSSVSYADKYLIRVPYGSTTATQMALPTTFPYPQIEQGSISADSLDTYTLLKDSMNGSSIAIHLTQNTAGNLSYDLLSESVYDNSHWQYITLAPSYAPTAIKNQYLQFPDGGLANYRSTHPNFNADYLKLQTYIAGNNSITTYQIANTIKNYLDDNFQPETTFPLARPNAGQDVVEWFLGNGEGLPMDFAAAFVMFCRAFGVPSRYTSGFNSLYTSDTTDPGYGDRTCREITFMNMYAWNEIYFPTSTSGAGQFSPFLLSPSISYPPTNQTSLQGYALNVKINGTYSNTGGGLRGTDIGMQFGLSVPSSDGTNASQTLTLYDTTYDQSLPSVTTDSNGYANYIYSLNNSVIAGVHAITVTYSPLVKNMTILVLVAPVNIQLSSVNPTYLDRTITNSTAIQSYIYDPANNGRLRDVLLNPVVAYGTAAIINSTSPSSILVDDNGAINQNVTITDIVDQGSYNFRVDYNGSFLVSNPYDPSSPYQIDLSNVVSPAAAQIMYASSNTIPFQVNDPNQKVFDMYMNGTTPGSDITVDRSSSTLNFTVFLKQGTNVISGGIVNIYDKSYSNTSIASVVTGSNGWGSTLYKLSTNINQWVAGPHELYGVWSAGSRVNGSFYAMVNSPVQLLVNSFGPSEINRTGTNTQFSISGYLWDNGISAYVHNGLVTVRLLKNSVDSSSYLSPTSVPMSVGSTGQYSGTYGVLSSTPIGQYDVRVDFNGTWIVNGHTVTSIPLSVSSSQYALSINDPTDVSLQYWINGTAVQSSYLSSNALDVYKGQYVNLTVRLKEGLNYPSGQTINFYDELSSQSLGSCTTNSNGYGTLILNIDNSFAAGLITAGLNVISASYGTVKNYTDIFLNDNMAVNFQTPPLGTYVRNKDTVTIGGFIQDSLGNNIKGAAVQLIVKDDVGTDVTNQITSWITGSSFEYSSESNGQWVFSFKFPLSFRGTYSISVNFTGEQYISYAACPADYVNSSLLAASSTYQTTVYAGVVLTAYYSPSVFTVTQDVSVYGTLEYDNGTLFSSPQLLNVTFETSSDQLCSPTSYNDSVIFDGQNYNYSSSTTILWSNTANIFVTFYTDTVNLIWGSTVQAVYGGG